MTRAKHNVNGGFCVVSLISLNNNTLASNITLQMWQKKQKQNNFAHIFNTRHT